MNILLMGCSWGVPNYFGLPGDPAEVHTEFLLKKLGHNVYNCSLNGGSNLTTLSKAKQFLSGNMVDHPALPGKYIQGNINLKIDLVIWFHTDPGRDMNSDKSRSIRSQLDEMCANIYTQYSEFFKNLNCKVAIIGACADVNPIITDYISCDFLLPSWQKDLIGVSSQIFKFETILDQPTDDDIFLLENAINVVKVMTHNRHLFPDGCHPGGTAHSKLLDTLTKNSIL